VKKQKIKLNAQLLYVIAIAWLVAGVGCLMRQVGVLSILAFSMGLIHLAAAIITDIRECKKN